MLALANSFHIPLQDKSVHCAITSPPYFGLRNYGLPPQVFGGERGCQHVWGEEKPPHHPGQVEQTKWKDAQAAGHGQTASTGQFCQLCNAWRGSLGNEPTIDLYVQHLVEVGREVWRVLRDDGVFWLNLGDSFCDKQLQGIPWRVALALQADGWYLRRDIIWHKLNPMPESVTDRPSTAHEYVFMLTKKSRYFWDMEAVREPHQADSLKRYEYGLQSRAPKDGKIRSGSDTGVFKCDRMGDFISPSGRNIRSVWSIATESYPGAHFATFPTKLVEPMIKSSTSQRGVCSECGKQWERVVEKDGERKTHGINLVADEARGSHGKTSVFKTGKVAITKTTGWQPSCNCNAPVVPAIVFDPFTGSGTVGEVCRNLNRRFVGLDLSAEYLAINALPRAEGKTSQKAIEELPLFKRDD